MDIKSNHELTATSPLGARHPVILGSFNGCWREVSGHSIAHGVVGPSAVSTTYAGGRFAPLRDMSVDLTLGRWLAFMRHPQAAWRRLDRGRRAALVGSYAGLGYVGTLALLLAFR